MRRRCRPCIQAQGRRHCAFKPWRKISRHVSLHTGVLHDSALTRLSSQPPLLTLYEIRKFAPHIFGKDMQIFVDGGVRRGTDILKALCLGANAVGIGRPVLFSMSGGYGYYGVRRMIQILRKELQTNMAFLGARRVEDLRPDMVNVNALERRIVPSSSL